MRTLTFILALALAALTSPAQTFVEVTSPEDASLVLLEVKTPADADVCVYKTRKNSESAQWDLMWKFRKGGWANYTVFIAQTPDQLYVPADQSLDEVERDYIPAARVCFVQSPEGRGYLKKGFQIEGVMKVKHTGKLKIRKRDLRD